MRDREATVRDREATAESTVVSIVVSVVVPTVVSFLTFSPVQFCHFSKIPH